MGFLHAAAVPARHHDHPPVSLLREKLAYLAATSLESQGSSIASMQPPKKRKKKDDDDSLLIEHLGKLTNSLEEQDDHHHFALSLVRSMRELEEEHHLDMRMKIIEVIKQFKSS